jgi:hypothetical protein
MPMFAMPTFSAKPEERRDDRRPPVEPRRDDVRRTSAN